MKKVVDITISIVFILLLFINIYNNYYRPIKVKKDFDKRIIRLQFWGRWKKCIKLFNIMQNKFSNDDNVKISSYTGIGYCYYKLKDYNNSYLNYEIGLDYLLKKGKNATNYEPFIFALKSYIKAKKIKEAKLLYGKISIHSDKNNTSFKKFKEFAVKNHLDEL